jgi:hypothetical protein
MPSLLSWSPSRGIHGYLLFEIRHLTVLDSSYDCNSLTRDQHQLALIPPTPSCCASFPFHCLSLHQSDLVVNCHISGLVCNMPSLLPWSPLRGIHGYLLFEIRHLTVLDSSYDCNSWTRDQHQLVLIPRTRQVYFCLSDLVVNCHIFGLVCNMPSLLPWSPLRRIHGYLLFEILHLTVLDSSYVCNLLTRVQH